MRSWCLQAPSIGNRNGRFGARRLHLPSLGLKRSRGRYLSSASCCKDASIHVKAVVNRSRPSEDVNIEDGKIFATGTPVLERDVMSSAIYAVPSSEYFLVAPNKGGNCDGAVEATGF